MLPQPSPNAFSLKLFKWVLSFPKSFELSCIHPETQTSSVCLTRLTHIWGYWNLCYPLSVFVVTLYLFSNPFSLLIGVKALQL